MIRPPEGCHYRVICKQCGKSRGFCKWTVVPSKFSHFYGIDNDLDLPDDEDYDSSHRNFGDIEIDQCASCRQKDLDRIGKEMEEEKKKEDEANKRICTKCGNDYDVRETSANLCPRCQCKYNQTTQLGYSGPSFEEWKP